MSCSPDRPARWHPASVALHWLTLLLVLFQFWIAGPMRDESRDLISRFELYQRHKSVGLTIALLVVLRLMLRLAMPQPEPFERNPWQRGAAASVHAGLYLCLLALPVSILVVRYPGPLARWAQRLPYLLQALPGLVIALSLVYFALHYVPDLYQTSALLLIAYALLFLPLAQAPIRVALEKASPQLEEAARTLGQTPLRAFLRITLPIISPAMGAGFVLVFLDSMKELTATLVLGPTGLTTLATAVWVHTSTLEYAAAAPYAALLILISGVPVYLLTTRAARSGR